MPKRRWLSWAIPIGIFLFSGTLFLLGLLKTDFQYVYPLDDTYIHLSIAKNLALHGNWGLSPDQFQFSSSSPAYTVLLAVGYVIFGVNVWLPLLLNFLLAIAFWISLRQVFSTHQSCWTGVLFFLGPIPLLLFCGMEHLLQSYLAVFLAWYAIQALSRGENFSWKIYVLSMLLVLVRYEGLFIVMSISCLALLLGRVASAIKMGLVGLLPITVVGLLSMRLGGTFLPLSIWMKGHSPGADLSEWIAWGMAGLTRLYEHPFLLVLAIVVLVLAGLAVERDKSWQTFSVLFPLFFLLTMLCQVFFAEVGGYRYEAYLICLGIVYIGHEAGKMEWTRWRRLTPMTRWIGRLLGLLILFPLLVRVGFFYLNYPLASQNIYQQQIQMARFIEKEYPTASVAANDIGAITYFSEIQLTDLLGIGEQIVAEHRKSGSYSAEVVQELSDTRQIEIAVVHREWVEDFIPATWTPVASWTISDNFICAFSTVTWYAVQEDRREELLRQLRDFEAELPEGISVMYD